MEDTKYVLQHIMRVQWAIHFEGHTIKKINFEGTFMVGEIGKAAQNTLEHCLCAHIQIACEERISRSFLEREDALHFLIKKNKIDWYVL